MKVHILKALKDNYIYLLEWEGRALSVDPSEAEPVLKFLKDKNLRLDFILNTHHHWDHVGGNERLKKEFGCKIFGPEKEKIPGKDVGVKEGPLKLDEGLDFFVFEIPGHTLGHVAYWRKEGGLLFVGDTLFSMGCGRLFEGSFQDLFSSLQKLSKLPDSTQIYCGHEYSLKNARFALKWEPSNPELPPLIKKLEKLQREGKPSLPVSLGLEKKTNPFLRTENEEIKKRLNLPQNSPPDQVFKVLRKERDLV